VVLDLDEVVLAPEDVHEPGGRPPGLLPPVVQQVLGHERGQAAGEADQAAGVPGQRVQVGAGLVIEALQVGVADELQEVLVALDVAGEQPEVEDAPALVAPALLLEPRALGKVELAADEGLDALGLGRV
jgi:hypothetical protein